MIYRVLGSAQIRRSKWPRQSSILGDRKISYTLRIEKCFSGAWHAFNRVRLRCYTPVIIVHREAGGIDLKKLLCVGTAPIDVDGDNRKAVVTVTLLHLVHPGERSAARRAPRSPIIIVYDSAVKIRERYRLAVSDRQRSSAKTAAP